MLAAVSLHRTFPFSKLYRTIPALLFLLYFALPFPILTIARPHSIERADLKTTMSPPTEAADLDMFDTVEDGDLLGVDTQNEIQDLTLP
jgi:hypothetical protein